MDKNTITGLVLIAILLVGFSFLSRPSQEQLEAQQRYYDSIAQVQQRQEALKAKSEAALANEKEAEASVDSAAIFFNALQGTDSQVIISNNLAEIAIDAKGGRIASATLKEYMGQDKTTPVTLFSGNDASMNFCFIIRKRPFRRRIITSRRFSARIVASSCVCRPTVPDTSTSPTPCVTTLIWWILPFRPSAWATSWHLPTNWWI